MRVFLIFVFCTFLAFSAQAQQNKYTQWSDPSAPAPETDTDASQLKTFTKKLGSIVDQAEKDRAADPRFLNDIRELISKFTSPWSAPILRDKFHDGNYDADPAWFVAQGEFWIEKDRGLRSVVDKNATKVQETRPEENRKLSNEEKAALILGAILGNGGNREQQQTETTVVDEMRRQDAIISTNAKLTNAFMLEVNLSSWTAPGHLEFGVYQQGAANAGYRVIYTPGDRLELVRVSRRGVRVIDSTNRSVTLEDNKKHSLRLVRTPEAVLSVELDGNKIIEVTDRSFNDPFNGVLIGNRGGDFIIQPGCCPQRQLAFAGGRSVIRYSRPAFGVGLTPDTAKRRSIAV